ncbi:MAG: copper resistance protein B [Nitrospira sp.]|nr:copper resistance protein B [Nitrospira sp.]
MRHASVNVAYRNCRVALAVFVLHVGFSLTSAWAESKHEHMELDSGPIDQIGPLQPGSRARETEAVPEQWPPPVHDEKQRLFTLVDVLEYRPGSGGGKRREDYRWDVEGWYGGDYNRLWFKSEGQQDTAFKADYDADFQLLYGRFLWKYYDIQVGGRMEAQSFRGSNVTRGLGVIGFQGIVPYNYEFESALFIAQNGAVSARLSYTKDFLLTQRLIFQGRFQTNLAIQRVEEFTTGSGLNNLEFGGRLRYEIRRKFAPYIGASFERSVGETATLVRRQGGDPSQVRFVVGVRMWF